MSRAFPNYFRITQPHRSRWKMTCGFLLWKLVRAVVKIHDNDVREPVLSHAILKNRNAYDVRITRGNTSSYSNRRFCVEKRLTKPRVCGIIFPASERGSPRSNRTFRGIAQLVEPRSPNVNRGLISRIITGFLRLETSVSSLFSCL